MNSTKLTKEEIKKLASLSKIKLSNEEVEKFTVDMDTILSSVETLQDFEKDTGIKLEATNFNETAFAELREDKPATSMSKEEVLANAPNQEKGYFKVYGNTVEGDNS